jgi:CBS domain-containing protein
LSRLIYLDRSVHEIADFLSAHPPFDAMDAADLDRVQAATEIEFHLAGAVIISSGAAALEHLWVVRSGAVEVVLDGRVLDLLGPGELFGHGSMLSGLPAGFTARAAEDTLCYRIRADVAAPLLARPAGVRYVARSLLQVVGPAAGEPPADSASRPVAELVGSPLVVCSPGTSIREAARRMADARATSVVVDLGDGRLGILTDRDLRARVVAAGRDTDDPVSTAMSAPAYTVGADRPGGEALLDMLDRGIRHLPVVSPTGAVVGVLEDSDLVAAVTRGSFALRAAVARAASPEEVAAAAARLWPAVLELHAARVPAGEIAAIHSVVVDAVCRRLLELAVAEGDVPAVPFAWFALGSVARREAVPSSDVDSALIWYDEPAEAAPAGRGPGAGTASVGAGAAPAGRAPGGGTASVGTGAAGRAPSRAPGALPPDGDDDRDPAPALRALAARVVDGMEASGFPSDPRGAVASRPLFSRSASDWRAAARSWLEEPSQEKALVLVSLAGDGRPVWGIRTGLSVPDAFQDARRHPDLLRLLARFALSFRPPTGFLRDFVVEHSGQHRGRLDIKHGGVVPIVDLARWAGMVAGVTSGSTRARLQAAAGAGTLPSGDAGLLAEAFDLIAGVRLDHQVEQLRAGRAPDDFIHPGTLGPVMRASLKEAFRTVASVQRRIANELQLGLR